MAFSATFALFAWGLNNESTYLCIKLRLAAKDHQYVKYEMKLEGDGEDFKHNALGQHIGVRVNTQKSLYFISMTKL